MAIYHGTSNQFCSVHHYSLKSVDVIYVIESWLAWQVTTVVNVMALDVVGTAVAQVVLGIRVLGLKTNAGTAMFVMVMASVLSVFKKLPGGRRFMRDMKKTIVSIVLQVATVDSA